MAERIDEAPARDDLRAARRPPMPPDRRVELAVSAAVLALLVIAVLVAVLASP